MNDIDSWPECVLREQTKALHSYRELCKKCRQWTVNWQLMLIASPSCAELDSWPNGKKAELRKVSTLARKLLRQIRCLRAFPHVTALAHDHKIGRADLLHPLCNLDERFTALLDLDKLFSGFGPRQRPDSSKALCDLIRYVKHSSGRPNYDVIQDVLVGLGIPAPNLRQWYWDRQNPKKSKTNRSKTRP